MTRQQIWKLLYVSWLVNTIGIVFRVQPIGYSCVFWLDWASVQAAVKKIVGHAFQPQCGSYRIPQRKAESNEM